MQAAAALDMRAVAARFWPKVDKSGPVLRAELGACWVWTAATNEHGYGLIGRGARGMGSAKAHRVSWEIAHGSIASSDVFVLHRCDNRLCVNPSHLFLGSNLDNVRDMRAKGRGSNPPLHVGEANPRSLITAETAKRIRRLLSTGITAVDVARRTGVSIHVVYGIRHGRTWRHVA